jgi:tryptophanyl-tRNA synthetase
MKTMITGIQPTGNFTLGNYLGAIKNFVKLQDKYNSYIFIADLHGLTSYQNPSDIHERILDLAAIYLACGVDPLKTNFFIQSDVLEHTELGFLIAFQCRVGELSRMTQYKSKKKNKDLME